MDDDHRFKVLGVLPKINMSLHAPYWIEAVFLTMVDNLREVYVLSRGLSWVTMSPEQRRKVYAVVLERFRANFPTNFFTPGNGWLEWDRVLDLLIARDRTLSPLGDPLT